MTTGGISHQEFATKGPFPIHNNNLTISALLAHLPCALLILCALGLIYIMIFNSLLHVANRAIKDIPFFRPGEHKHLRSRSLKPQIFTATSQTPVPFYQPQPNQPSLDMCSLSGDILYPQQDDDSSPPSSPSPGSDSSSSLVPTVVATRSPSPQPHPCVEQAREFGIKVRDFAYEKHSVPLAPTIPDVGQLKVNYNLYRSVGLTPPSETMDTLQKYEPEWFIEAERQYEASSNNPNTKPATATLPWRVPAEPWRGVETNVPVPQKYVEEAEPSVNKITSWLQTVTLQHDSRDGEVA